MLLLKPFKTKAQGLADLLKYGVLIEPSIILNKDGSFMTMYYYRGDDTASSTPHELNFRASQLNTALQSLGDGWVAHFDAIRTSETFYPGNNHFPDPVSQLIDDERRGWFKDATCFRTDQYLTLSYLPNYKAQKLLASASGNKSEQELEQVLRQFKAAVRAFEDIAASVLYLRRLGSYEKEEEVDGVTRTVVYSEFLSMVHYIVTGILQPIRLSESPVFLDSVLPSQPLMGGVTPKIGDYYIATVSIDGLPHESYPAMLRELDTIPLEFRFNSRFVFLDKMTASKELEDYFKSWNQRIYKFTQMIFPSENPKVNTDALMMAEDAKIAQAELESDLVGYGYISSTVVLLGRDLEELEESARVIRKVVQALGFGCRIESINTLDSWFGSHPGNSFANIRKPLVNTMNLAHLLPTSTVWHGRPINPCPFYPENSPCLSVFTTDGNTPFYYNPHVGDLGHTLITGTTGSGKSVLLGLKAVQFRRYAGANLFCFDKSNSMEILCHGVKGSHFDIGKSGGGLSFAPLRSIGEGATELSWAAEWIETLINLQTKDPVQPKQRNHLTDALKELAGQPPSMRSLTHFYNIIYPKDQDMALALRHYTLQGAMGSLLDASDDNLSLSDFTVFEIEELMNMGDRNLIPVLLYLFHRIEKSLRGQPSMIILDEAWIMLGHPVFREKIREWLKMLRKANCMVVLATQQLSDAFNSGIMDVLIDSCPTKFYLPNSEANKNKSVMSIYERCGLNETEINLIASATPKRDYYLKSLEGSRMVNLKLMPRALAFLGSSDKESIALVRRLKTENPDGWIEEWLKIKAA